MNHHGDFDAMGLEHPVDFAAVPSVRASDCSQTGDRAQPEPGPPLKKSCPPMQKRYVGERWWDLQVIVENSYQSVTDSVHKLAEHFGLAGASPENDWFQHPKSGYVASRSESRRRSQAGHCMEKAGSSHRTPRALSG